MLARIFPPILQKQETWNYLIFYNCEIKLLTKAMGWLMMKCMQSGVHYLNQYFLQESIQELSWMFHMLYKITAKVNCIHWKAQMNKPLLYELILLLFLPLKYNMKSKITKGNQEKMANEVYLMVIEC